MASHDIKSEDRQALLPADYEKQDYIEEGRPIEGDIHQCAWHRWTRGRNFTTKAAIALRWMLAFIVFSLGFKYIFDMASHLGTKKRHHPSFPSYSGSSPFNIPVQDICHSLPVTDHVSFDFNTAESSGFGVYQIVNTTGSSKPPYGVPLHTSGQVRVKRHEPANPEELIASPIRAEIELSYSDPALRGLVDIEGLPKALTISVPPTVPVSKDGCAFDPSAAASRPPFCISVNVDLLVAPDATFSDFAIVSSFLDQIFLPGLNLNVSNSTFFSSISGSILVPPASSSSSHSSSMAPCHSSSSSSSSGIAARTDDDSTTLFDSRRTIITTTSGSIEGAFKLLDLLSLQTHSGSIKVDVSPQDAAPAPELPKPAAFSASSLSGSVEVRYPIRALGSEVPARNYTVHAESISGSVSGTFFHGEYTSLKSKSGHVEASLLPVIVTEGKKSFLRTQTVSGSTEIDIHDPLYLLPDSDTTTNDVSDVSDDDDKGKFNGEHATVSGSLKLRYPGEWEGTITGSSTSGSLDVRGKGVEVQKKTDLPWSHQLVAKKGDGNSHIGFHTTSGSVDLLVGEEV